MNSSPGNLSPDSSAVTNPRADAIGLEGDLAAGPPDDIRARLAQVLQDQRTAFDAHPSPDYRNRKASLLALKRLVSDNHPALVEAINADYGNRSRHETMFSEIVVVLESIDHALRHLKRWMKPRRRRVDWMIYPGARNLLIPQPLGVVGVIVPWNFPVQLAFAPLANIFAAGNSAMVKLSENSPRLAELLTRLSPDYFPAEKLQFFAETGNVGVEFSQLPFDHLLFTGSGQTGRKVMAACAENLTPVTLELGGKSPAVIAPDYPLKRAVERILYGKLLNAGQACVGVDHCYVPADRLDAFVSASREYVARHYPDIASPDYTSIIDDRSFERLQASLEDAAARGAELINLSAPASPLPRQRKFPPHLVLGADDRMEVMQREIFGPVLPVFTYTDPRDVVDAINRRDRPLAFYPFTHDRKLQRFYIEQTRSGGVCINDTLLHVAQHDLPFGGIGPSGMGHYHGREGFETFSKLRPVFHQARFSSLKLLAPPYGRLADRVLDLLIRLHR
ncbi:coniferyl aldehyde dehydrogenase [Elongatibacter sediminis]|uniref:Aldehyde dehydrogenase n=1 Tax=Elongatibacter sediminis TaxID=3119006 RepID=A0AAW9RCS1_9GAMM